LAFATWDEAHPATANSWLLEIPVLKTIAVLQDWMSNWYSIMTSHRDVEEESVTRTPDGVHGILLHSGAVTALRNWVAGLH